MAVSRPPSDNQRQPDPRLMQEAVALALDGVVSSDPGEAEAAYRAAMDAMSMSDAMSPLLNRLRQLGEAGFVASSGRFDDADRLLDSMGVTSHPVATVPDRPAWPGVLFVGCVRGDELSHSAWIEAMLDRGAIIVSSDLTAGAPIISETLNVMTRRPPARARVAINPRIADNLASQGDWGQLVSGLNPAVRLAPGHLALAREQRVETRILARNALTDEPLVVSARIGNGWIVHSVAHWWQEAQPDSTELGRRPLASIRRFAALGREHPEARLGGFAAASVLLVCLLVGLESALDGFAGASTQAACFSFADGSQGGGPIGSPA